MQQRLLLVEDDKNISLALSLRLESMGYQVDSAPDAVCAMDVAVRSKPEAVLLDINLPGGNGFMVADRIRASDSLKETPIVFITASREPGLRSLAEEYDAACFIEKPFQAVQLLEAIDSLCH